MYVGEVAGGEGGRCLESPSIRNIDIVGDAVGGSMSDHQRVSTFQVNSADAAICINITQEPRRGVGASCDGAAGMGMARRPSFPSRKWQVARQGKARARPQSQVLSVLSVCQSSMMDDG